MYDSSIRLNSHISIFTSILSKITRHFNRIGYIRAARELRRLGYYKEAEVCIKELNKL